MKLKRLGGSQKNITEHSQAEQIKDEIQSAYDAVKQVKSKLKKFGKTNKEMSTLKKALRNMVDELEDLEDLDLEDMESSEEDEVSDKNEQSEGYGSWKGLGMEEQVIKLSNNDLNGIFERISNNNNLITEDREFVKRQIARCRNGNASSCQWLDDQYDNCGCVYCCGVVQGDNCGPGEVMGTDGNCVCDNPKLCRGGDMNTTQDIRESRLLLERPTAEEAREGCDGDKDGCCRCYYHGMSCEACEESIANIGKNPKGGDKGLKAKDDGLTISESVNRSIRKSYRLIKKTIINEGGGGLRLSDYGLINEQGQYDRNPGIAAGEGIEVVIDNLKKAWSMLKDSTTRKQIQNTLVKLNNFMMYSAELVGSGSSKRNPRSYNQLSNPLPYPELDEPEELEDIDDGLEDFDAWMDDLSDRNGTTDY